MAGPCPECGLDPSTIGPGDAVVTVRSLPRRWRGLLAMTGEDEDARDLVRRRPADGGPSVLEQAAIVRDVLADAAGQVRRSRIEDRPSLPPLAGGRAEPAPPPDDGVDPSAVVAELGDRADALAAELDQITGDEWVRPVVIDDREATLLDVAREAAHLGTHHLRQAEATLRQVRGHSD